MTLGLVVAIVVWEWKHRTSPGPLHPSHASVLKLQGKDGCDACHGKHASELPAACLVCHAEIQQQIDAGRGLHGYLKRDAAMACALCHTDHTGDRMPMVANRSFQAAGFPSPQAFDHAKLGDYVLAGRHIELKCEKCHPSAPAAFLAEGQKRYLGLAQECVTCHKDPHEGAYGTDCLACHGQSQPFAQAPDFVHPAEFPLEGGHANQACAKCHEKTGPTSVLVLLSSEYPVRTCTACHDDPHTGALGNDCASCHGTSRPFDQAAEFKHTDAFPLVGAHAGRACTDCHERSGAYSVAALKVQAMTVRTCQQCHTSPHRESVVSAVAQSLQRTHAESCTACHRQEDATFLAPIATMTPVRHGGTGFALDAPHDKAKCVDCHAEIGKRPPLAAGPDLASRFAELYPGRSQQACEKCHEDPHGGQFRAAESGGECIACHAPAHFAPSNFDLAEHAKTRLPLEGAHRAVACSLCHKEQDAVVQFVSTPLACAACHADVHAGRFDEPGRPVTVQNRSGCARCHDATGFSRITWTPQDHAVWTGYPLNEAHAGVSCAACHRPLAQPDEHGRTMGMASQTCSACHADVHAGQFSRQGVTDCARCHTDSATFAQTTFDHQRDSAYVLDEKHAKLTCAACHRPFDVGGGAKVIRYRPLGTRCQDCHDPRGRGAMEVP
jgi:hypothetical protein